MPVATQKTMEGVCKLSLTDTRLTANGPSIHLPLAGQVTVYNDSSATYRTRDGSAGVTVACGDLADPTTLHGVPTTSL